MRDESAQAMTEFVIVMPVVLLVFFTIFQLIMIWNAYLLTGYAAFAATRAAATYDAHIGTSQAQQLAKNAAALALMPISRPVEGELAFYTSRTGAGNIRSFLQNQCGFKKHLLDKLPPVYNRVSGEANSGTTNDEKLEWLFTAWNRLHYNPQARFRQSFGKQAIFEHKIPDKSDEISDKLGDLAGTAVGDAIEDKIGSGPIGDIKDNIGSHFGGLIGGKVKDKVSDKVSEKMSAPSELTEINVEISYDYPLFIPGFAALWDALSGPKVGDLFTQKSPSILHYFYTMKSRCAVGYETFFRDFENTGEQGNPDADLLKSLDMERITEVQQEIIAATTLLATLKGQLAQCPSQFKSLGYDTAIGCQVGISTKIAQTEALLQSLADEMEDLTHF